MIVRLAFLPFLLLVGGTLYGNEIDTLKLKPEIGQVTVFFDGAQIDREAEISVSPGKYQMVLENLSAELNAQSIQIDAGGKGEILSVKHEVLRPSDRDETVIEYEDRIKAVERERKARMEEMAVYEIEERVLMDNRVLGGGEQGASISEIREAADFYRSKLNEIRRNKLNLLVVVDSLNEVIRDLYRELNERTAANRIAHSKISIAFGTDEPIRGKLRIRYFVPSAGWSPLYDFRVDHIEAPLSLVYRANIFQSTGEDWNRVNLTLSTSRPSLSNHKPELDPWYVERGHVRPPTPEKEGGNGILMGTVKDGKTQAVLPFANIQVMQEGRIVAGVNSNFDGAYTVRPLKAGRYDVKVSYLGYNSMEMRRVDVRDSRITFLDFALDQSGPMLEEVEVMEYSAPLIEKDGRASGGIIRRDDISPMPSRKENALASSVGGRSGSGNVVVSGYEAEANITALEYKIDIPHTILSDGSDNEVIIQEVHVPVAYFFKTAPKLDTDAFLIAEIEDWADLNLISGPSSVYYNGVFTGHTEIEAESLRDTLAISLSRDKDIIVERTSQKERNERSIFGNNIQESVNWKIEVRNNKPVGVKVFVEDQIPISQNKSITINHDVDAGGKVDERSGKVVWELDLGPNEKKEVNLNYSVRYPSGMHLVIQ